MIPAWFLVLSLTIYGLGGLSWFFIDPSSYNRWSEPASAGIVVWLLLGFVVINVVEMLRGKK